MRVAFVTPSYPPDLGGLEVVVSELARRIAVGGHTVEVFAHASRLAGAGSERRDGVLVHRFRVPVPSHDFAVSPALIAALVRSRHRFDIVHAHNFHASPALGAALIRMGPMVFTPYYHGGGHRVVARLAHLAYRPASRLLFRACEHIVCISAAEANSLTRDFPSINAPVTVVQIGVDQQAFAQAEPFDVTPNLVVAAGRMEPYKQFDRIVLAADHLPDDTELVLLGDGPARPGIETLVARRGPSSRVHVVGRVSDEELRRWFRTAKVLVSLSRHESFGLTIAEALAAGTPVVASDIPAHRETAIGQPATAVRLVSADAHPNRIADAIVDAIASGLPSGVRVPAWDDTVQKVMSIYETTLSAGPSRDLRSASTSR